MEVLSTYEEDEYIITKYSNGTIEKIKKSIEPIIEDVEDTVYSKDILFNSQILNKLDYIECLAELNSMKGR